MSPSYGTKNSFKNTFPLDKKQSFQRKGLLLLVDN